MFISDTGAGAPVILVPGLGATHEMYRPQIEALSPHLRVLAPDLRGCGASEPLGGVAVDDVLDVQVGDLVAMLDGLGLDAAHVVGISYGGGVVERMMLTHPERVLSAVICDSLCDTRPRTFPEWCQTAPAHLQPLLLRLPRRWVAASFHQVYQRWPEAGRQMARTILAGDIDDLILQRRAINRLHHEEALREVRIPTLCLVGDHNRFAISMMRRVHEAIPGSQFRIIADSFDPSSLCQPQEFSRLVLGWVRSHSAGGYRHFGAKVCPAAPGCARHADADGPRLDHSPGRHLRLTRGRPRTSPIGLAG